MSYFRSPGSLGLTHISGRRASAADLDGNALRLGIGTTVTLLGERESQRLESHPPLLLFFGGFFDATTNNFKPHADAFKAPNAFIKYFSWDGRSEAVRHLSAQLKRTPNSPVVLVGHSYGGDTAMDVARDLKGVSVQLAVTLDAVSQFGFRLNVRASTVVEWVNIYVEGVHDFSDVVAVIGGHWGDESEADTNISAKSLPHTEQISHGSSGDMLAGVAAKITATLGKRIMRSAAELQAINLLT